MKSITYCGLLIISIVFCLFSCKSAQVRDAGAFIWLTDSSRFFLLPPVNIDKTIDDFQVFSASYGDQMFHANVWVIADDTGIDMTLMNEMGTGMGDLIWKGNDVLFSSNIFPDFLQGEYIIADFQFCFYNAAALESALKNIGLFFEETNEGRRIIKNGNIIIDITKNDNIVVFINYLRGYTFSLEGVF